MSQDSPSLCPVFFSVLALLNLRLLRCVALLILASSSLRVSSSDHSLPRRRRTVVTTTFRQSESIYTTTSRQSELSPIFCSVGVRIVARLDFELLESGTLFRALFGLKISGVKNFEL